MSCGKMYIEKVEKITSCFVLHSNKVGLLGFNATNLLKFGATSQGRTADKFTHPIGIF